MVDAERDPSDVPEAVERVQDCRRASESHLQGWMDEAERCYAFVAGKQWTDEEEAQLKERNRLPVVFNRVAPIINAIRGQEVNNRTEVRYIPRREGVSGVDEMMTQAARYIRENCDAEDEDADAFNDLLVTGLGWTGTRMDYESNQDGDAIVERRDPLHMRYDPSARKRNLTDMRWVQADDFLSEDELKARWPDADCESLKTGDSQEEGDAVRHVTAVKYGDSAVRGYDAKAEKYCVTHHVEIQVERYFLVLDAETQQLVEMDAERVEALEKMGAPLQKRSATRRKYWQCFVSGAEVLEEGPAPCQMSFPYKAMTGYRDRNNGTFHGLVRYMLDPAKFANKLFSLMHHVIASNSKGGVMFEAGAVTNVKKFEDQWADPSSSIQVNAGALSGGKIMPKPMGEYPVQMDHLLEFSVSSIRDSVGVPLELLGMAEKDQPGVLEAQRVRSSLTLLSVLFDSLRAYRKQHGRLLAEYIREFMSDGRLIRLTGQWGAKYVPLLRDPQTTEYDIQVDEAPTARDVKERTFAVLMALVPNAVQLGYPVPREILDYAPIPEGLRESWKAQIAQAGPQQKPSPEQIKVQGALALDKQKHANKLAEIAANTNADLTREAAQASSEQLIDEHKARLKAGGETHTARVQHASAEHAAGLEARLARLEAALALMSHHATAEADHERAVELAETQAKLRPKPKAAAPTN